MAATTAGSTYELYAIAAAVIGGAQSQRSAEYHHGLRPWCTDHDDHRKWRKPLGIDAFTLQLAIGALIVLAVWIDRIRKGRTAS